MMMKFWNSCALANDLSHDELDLLMTLGQIKQYAGGDTIIRQFERSSDLFIVIDGRVRISSLAEHDLAEGGAGFVFGEMAVLDHQPRSASATACGPVELLVIPGDILEKLSHDSPVLGQKLMANLSRMIAARLRAANVRMLVG